MGNDKKHIFDAPERQDDWEETPCSEDHEIIREKVQRPEPWPEPTDPSEVIEKIKKYRSV